MGLIAKWTDDEREAPEPLEGPVVGSIVTGTVVWAVLFLGQLPFYGWFAQHDHTWWLWTCAAGAGLGCLGIWIVRRRDAALKRQAAEHAPTGTPETPAPRDGSGRRPAGAPKDSRA